MSMNPTEKAESEQLGAEFDETFRLARSTRMGAPAFMSTRVLARYREAAARTTPRRWARHWLVRAALPAAIMAAVLPFIPRNPLTEAVAGKGTLLVIRPSGTERDLRQVTAVQVDLPPGVQFYSEELPQLANVGALTLPFDPSATDGLPVAVRSDREGVQRIQLRYLDSSHQIVKERSLRIRFKKETAL